MGCDAKDIYWEVLDPRDERRILFRLERKSAPKKKRRQEIGLHVHEYKCEIDKTL